MKNKFKSESRITIRLSTLYGNDNYFSRFGIEIEELPFILNIFEKYKVEVSGFHFHVGSNVNSTIPWIKTIQHYKSYIYNVFSNCTHTPILDIGGGYPCLSQRSDSVLLGIEKWTYDISRELNNIGVNVDNMTLVVEPGRHFVEQFGSLYSKVGTIKEFKNHKNIILCCGTNFIRSFHAWKHPMKFLEDCSVSSEIPSRNIYKVFGRNCFESDFFGEISTNKLITIKDWICIHNCGGYDIPSTNPWITPLPPIFAIQNGNFIELRSQQTFTALRNLWENNFIECTERSI